MIFLSIFIGLVLIPQVLNNDIWFLLNAGRYVTQSGIPHIEPFTMHENLHFVMQQWLSAVVFWQIYQHFGADGLFMLVTAIGAITLYVFYRLCMLVSSGNFQISAMGTAILGCIVSPLFFVTRPQIFSTLFLLLEVFLLEKYCRTGKKGCMVLLPLLSLVLINMHAAIWLMSIIVLLPFFADIWNFNGKSRYFVHDTRASGRILLLTAAGMLGIALLNPYYTEAMGYVFRSYGHTDINALVSEMQPMVINNILGKMLFLLTGGLVVFYARVKVPIRYICLTLGLSCMAFSSVRSLFLFLLLGTFPFSYIFRCWQPVREEAADGEKGAEHRRDLLMLIVSLSTVFMLLHMDMKPAEVWEKLSLQSKMFLAGLHTGALLLIVKYVLEFKAGVGNKAHMLRRQAACIVLCCLVSFFVILLSLRQSGEDSRTPAQAAAFLLEHYDLEQMKVWTNYYEGGYLEFQGIHVYIDARAEVFIYENNQEKDVFKEYIELQSGQLYYKDFIARYEFTHFLTCKDDILYVYLYNDPDYRLVYEDETRRLFEKVNREG